MSVDEQDVQKTNAEVATEPTIDAIEASAPLDHATENEDVILNTVTTTTTTAVEATIPSAPAIDDIEDEPQSSTHSTQHVNLLYPKLTDIKSGRDMVRNAAITNSSERITLQPFTNEQLKELYHNPELHMAVAFEIDFINTELNNTHKDHPLHELLKKYSRSRYNLKVNMLDLHAYIKCFQENSQKVWIIENRITTYEGVCTDGERIRKNELYEYALLNEPTFQKVASTLNNTLQLVCYNFMTNLYACESYRTQVSYQSNYVI